MIFVAGSGQNSIAVAPGANAKLNTTDIKRARLAIGNARVLLAQLETPLPAIQEAVELATSAGVRVILNPAPAQALPASLLKRLFLITPNEHEAQLLTGVSIESEQAASAARAVTGSGAEMTDHVPAAVPVVGQPRRAKTASSWRTVVSARFE